MNYLLMTVLMLAFAALPRHALPAQDEAQRLRYADFEELDKDRRPISVRGGKVIFDTAA